MARVWAILAALVTAAAAQAVAAADYEQVLSFREPLGHTWTDERVHRDVTVREKNVAARSFALADAEGRPVPVQVEVLEGKPQAVRKVRVWFKMTLPSGKESSFRLTYGDADREAPRPEGGAAVRRQDDRLVLSTGAIEVVVPAPPKPFGDARPLGEAPPIVAVQGRGAQTPWGVWQVESEARVKSIRATVEAEGPVWAGVRLTYAFEDRRHAYEVTLRAVAGEPWVDCQETYRLPDGGRMRLVLGEPFKPVRVFWLPWFVSEGNGVRPAYDLHRLVPASLVREGGPFATLRPKWTQTRDNGQACLAVGLGEGSPAVGVVAICAGDWQRPYDQFMGVRAAEEGREIAFEFPLGEGSRRWALVAGPASEFDSKGKLQGLIRKNADIPLDRVLNEWVFQWERDPARAAPHILTTLPRLQEIRAGIAADKDAPVVHLIRRVLAGEIKGDRNVAEFLAGRRDDPGGGGPGANLYLDRCYQDDFFNPTTYPRRLRRGMAWADLAAAGRPAGDAQAALVGYLFSDLNYWPGYANGWDAGNPNFHTDMYTLTILAAAMMPDHPHAERWMAFGIRNLKEDLRRVVFMPGGAGLECPGYNAYGMGNMLTVMRSIQNSGLDDPFKWPEVRASVEYLRHLHTPPDPRLGRRSLASVGDTHPWQDGTGVLFGMAAAGLLRADPAFATQCMAMYRHYYGSDGSGDLARDVLLVDPSIPEGRLDEMDWTSREFPGFGAVLRSRFGDPEEAFASFKCGPARGHYQGDELSFHFFGAGMPIALDWHCGYKPRPDQEHMHNRVNLGDDENMDAVGELVAFRTTDAGDLAVGQVKSAHLRKMPRYAHEITWQASYPRRALTSEARLRRFLLLVKHPAEGPMADYLVIRDEPASSEPATFNLFVLARSVERDGRRFDFDGQLAADAVAYFVAPEPERVRLDRWAWPKQDESSMIPEDFQVGKDRWRVGELQQWVRVSASPGDPFLVVLYPYRKGTPAPAFEALADGKGVRVSVAGKTEEVYLATDPAPEAGGQAVVQRDGRKTVILKAKAVPRL